MRDYLYILIIAAVVTYLLTPLVRRGSIAMGALHAARSRDVHLEPTPLLGGVAMYAGLAAGLLVAERLSYLQAAFTPRTVSGLLLAGGLLVLVGIIDDRWGMGAISKLAAQIAAGGILIWSGVYLPWVPLPNGGILSFEPDLSYTLTILIVVITINAVNFIDGLDGLAAGVVAIAAVSYLIYTYTLANSVGIQSQSVAALESAVLVGICIGFLPHNFHPARIFMGDTGAMLLGLLLAYGPISSLASLDQNVLINYSHAHPVNRFPTILPLLLPVAILIIPYADFLLAVIRRTRAGKSPLAADRQHLHHRLLNMGHSHRQSVLLMYLWAALFVGTVVGLSLERIPVAWLGVTTLGAMFVLLLATMPRLRPWRSEANGRRRARGVMGVRSDQAASIATYGVASVNGAVADGVLANDAVAGNGALPASGAVPGTGAVPANGHGKHAGDGALPVGPVLGHGKHSGNGAMPGNGAVPGNGVEPGYGVLPGEPLAADSAPPEDEAAPAPANGEVPGGPAGPAGPDFPSPPRVATWPWPSRH